jgi:hypothetical protein
MFCLINSEVREKNIGLNSTESRLYRCCRRLRRIAFYMRDAFLISSLIKKTSFPHKNKYKAGAMQTL